MQCTIPWETKILKNHEFSLKLQISVMVSIFVSKIGMIELIFVIPGMTVNDQYYCDVLLSQQMLPAIKHVAGDTFVFQQDNAPYHRARTPLNCYSKKRRTSLVLISGHQTAQTLHLVDYKVWGVMQLTVYECRMNSVDELKLRLIDV